MQQLGVSRTNSLLCIAASSRHTPLCLTADLAQHIFLLLPSKDLDSFVTSQASGQLDGLGVPSLIRYAVIPSTTGTCFPLKLKMFTRRPLKYPVWSTNANLGITTSLP